MTQTRLVLWLLGSCFIINISDVIVRILGKTLPAGEIMVLRGGIACLCCLAALAFEQRRKKVDWPPLRIWLAPRQLARGIINSATNILLIALLIEDQVRIAELIAIWLLSPIFFTVLYVIFHKEHVSLQQWGAIAFSFIGMLFVVQPQNFASTPLWLWSWALFGAFLVGLRDYLTKTLMEDIPSLIVAFTPSFFTLFAGYLFGQYFQEQWRYPTWPEAGLLVLSGALISAYLVIFTNALRQGRASFTTPWRYSQLPITLFLGFVVLGEIPSPLAWLGGAIIILSGIYSWYDNPERFDKEKKSDVPETI